MQVVDQQLQEPANPRFRVVPASYKPKSATYGDPNIDIHYTKGYIAWWIICTAIYFVFSPLLVMLAAYVPDYNTDSTIFQQWYYRIVVNTEWFPTSQFVSYMAFCIYGWSYINLVTLQRKDPFTSGNGGHSAFKKMILLTPILFLFSGIITLRARNDLSGYCTDDGESNDESGHKTHMLRASGNDVADCHEYTDDEIFNWNFYYWTTGFVLFGIQFSHVDIGPMQHFTLDWDDIKNWGPFLWSVLISLILVFGLAAHDIFTEMRLADCFTRYLVWAAGIAIFFVWQTKRLAPGRPVHLHHYVIGFFAITFIGYQSPVLTFLNGFFTGMFLEGGCRWGFDKIWGSDDDNCEESDDAITEPGMSRTHTTSERSRWIAIKAHQSKIRAQNEVQIKQAAQAQQPVFLPHPNMVYQPVSSQASFSSQASTTYLQPTMINAPVSNQHQVMVQGYNPSMACFQVVPVPVQQQQQIQPQFSYGYHPEPVHRAAQKDWQNVTPQQAKKAQTNQSNLPSELLGLLSPEL